MQTKADTPVKCGCCQETDILESEAPFDAELKVPICRDCRTQLQWAQARLKEQGIKGCVPEPI